MALKFDPTYYMKMRPDVLNAFIAKGGQKGTGLSWDAFAENHFNKYGWKEGYNPNATFDTKFYLQNNIDVLEAGVNPWQHYLKYGIKEGREPNANFPSYDSFDWETYVDANPDLQGKITDKAGAYAHFVKYGQFENRPGAPAVDNGIPGENFALTIGVDNIVGTSNNDVIVAQPVNPSGGTADTFSGFDTIDGGAGKDTLNIYTTNTGNDVFPAGASVKNVEIVNIYNTGSAAALGDASKFEGVQELWQHNAATTVTNLGAGTIAGFKNVNSNLTVRPAAGVSSAAIALDGYGEGKSITVAAATASTSALASVKVTGTVSDTNANGVISATTLAVTAGKDVEAFTLDTAVTTNLTLTENNQSAASKDIRTVDASASKGGVTFGGSVTGGTAGSVSTIKGGSGNDTLTIVTATVKDNAATPADETVSALLQAGAGNDRVTINTKGTGTTTVEAGDGNDVVILTDRGSGTLTVKLGSGDDTFQGAGTVNGTDVIDGGDGTDTLLLNMVGASNIGAFSNFEVFDAVGLSKTLDVDILASKNTVTEFVASGNVGASAALTNVGAGVGYRVTGDTNIANAMTLTQKTAGALTITLDIDETTAATTTATNRDASVIASNATSIKAVFDSSFIGDATNAADNRTDLDITGSAATSLEVVSGGENAINNLDYIYGKGAATAGADGLLKTVTVSGDRAITLNFSDGNDDAESAIVSVDASALTGSLRFNTSDLKASSAGAFDGGVVTLGAGADVISVTNGASIANIGKGAAEDATLQGAFDVLTTGAAVAQAADLDNAAVTIKDGKLVFKGAGPATLNAAIAAVDTAVGGNGNAVVFEYIGDSYVFVQNGASDIIVKLVGTTGLNGLDEVGTSDQLYVF